MSLYMHGLGHFHPENKITNQFLTDLDIGTNEEWIDERVGIGTRRTVLPLDYIRETRNSNLMAAIEAAEYTHAETGQFAANMALERAGLSADDIGMVIAGSSCPDHMSPADACMIAQRLGIEAPSFDVNSACTSFHVAMFMLSMMRPENVPEFVLLVTPESLTTTVDYSDRSAAVLWGDGTTAAVVSTRVPSRIEILGNLLESSPAGADKVTVPHFGHFGQEGRTVQMFAVKKTIRVLRKLREAHATNDRPFHFVGHQANLRMLETVCRQADIADDRHHHNVVDYGNTGAAGAPGVVSMRWDDWKSGDDVAIVGVGSGLTWSGILEITADGRRGHIIAEQDVNLDAWFFQCHFVGDPVQPGCLGVDAVWQLIGFYCAWRGALGTGRALGCGEVEFSGQIRPHDAVVRYEVKIARYTELATSAIAIGDARVLVDGSEIYSIRRAKVGVFRGIDYPDYPWPSENSRGGRMEE